MGKAAIAAPRTGCNFPDLGPRTRCGEGGGRDYGRISAASELVLRTDEAGSGANDPHVWADAGPKVVRTAVPKCLRPRPVAQQSLYGNPGRFQHPSPYREADLRFRRWVGEPGFRLCR